jgi:hypothetical protein
MRKQEDDDDYFNQDVGNIVLLEHINIDIDSQDVASIFYCGGLGLTRDPFDKVSTNTSWINIGYQQIHATNTGDTQVLDGMIGIVLPDINLIERNLKRVQIKLQGTKFAFNRKKMNRSSGQSEFIHSVLNSGEDSDDTIDYLQVTCPYGNTFNVYQSEPLETPSDSSPKVTTSLSIHGGIGIIYVLFNCERGRSKSIADFYNDKLSANTIAKDGYCRVSVGPCQELLFREVDSVQEYTGYHIAIYISNFSGTFKKIDSNNLIWYGPRFSDHVTTLSDALQWKQFRFKDLKEQGTLVFTLEHEIRSMYHPSYRRPLVNRYGSIGIFCNQ